MTVKEFSTPGTTIQFEEGPSNGPDLLLVHGLTGDRNVWQRYADALSASWHVFALDMRGHGQSGRASGYKLGDLASDIAAFIGSVSGPDVVYVGWSAGATAGIIAADIAGLRGPLVALDPGLWSLWEFKVWDVRKSFGALRDQLLSLTDIPAAERFDRYVGMESPLSDFKRSWARARTLLDPHVLDPYIAGTATEGVDLDSHLSRLRCPTLVIQGDSEAGGVRSVLTDGDVRRASSLLTDARIVKFYGMDHFLDLAQPGTPFGLVGHFIERHRTR